MGAAGYDYIVVGAGAGGAVVAARLAEGGASVLVIEAGGDPLAPAHDAGADMPLAAEVVGQQLGGGTVHGGAHAAAPVNSIAPCGSR